MTDRPAVVIEPAVDLSLTALAELFTRSFEGYVLPVYVTAQALAQRIRGEHVDLFESRVLSLDAALAGLALVARRGRTSRVAAMGIVPEARSRGLGRVLIDRLVDDARARGDRRLLLEVIESNAPAVALYRRAGFQVVRRLVSYEADRLEPVAGVFEEVDPDAFGRALQHDATLDLPWQLSPDTLAFATAPTRVFTAGGLVFASVLQLTETALVLRGIFTLPEHRRRGRAARLLRGARGDVPGARAELPRAPARGRRPGVLRGPRLSPGCAHAIRDADGSVIGVRVHLAVFPWPSGGPAVAVGLFLGDELHAVSDGPDEVRVYERLSVGADA